MDDVEAIRGLKARYFRTIDTKDWEAFRQVLADDVEIDTTDSGGDLQKGADDFVTFLIEAIGPAVTVHHGYTPEIELTSDTTATGIWAMDDLLQWPDGTTLHGYGHYHEAYEKTDGQWRIKTTKLTRLRMDFETPAPTDAAGN